MKYQITLSLILLALLGFFLLGYYTGEQKAKEDTKPAPTTLNMELYSVTPHGHQVFKKCENGCCVYTLLRHSDGYPIAMSSTCE
jgi:hypothetical protein